MPESELQTPELLILGHNESDARRLVEQAIADGKKFKDTETMIQAIYQKQAAH
jgi:Holliday junction DNA helicase RuvA